MSVDVWRFAKFLVIGGVNTAVGYGLYALFLLLTPLGPQPSLALAFALGVLWNYVSTGRFVFNSRGFGRLPAYVAAYLAVYVLNAQALSMAIAAEWSPLVAQAALLPFAAVLTYVALTQVFAERRTKG